MPTESHDSDSPQTADCPSAPCSGFAGRGTHNESGYRVEARVRFFNPTRLVQLSDGVLTDSWREVQFERGGNPAGVPEAWGYRPTHDLLTLEAATALAWTLVAQHPHASVEARLVAYRLRVQWEMSREGIVDGPEIGERIGAPNLCQNDGAQRQPAENLKP